MESKLTAKTNNMDEQEIKLKNGIDSKAFDIANKIYNAGKQKGERPNESGDSLDIRSSARMIEEYASLQTEPLQKEIEALDCFLQTREKELTESRSLIEEAQEQIKILKTKADWQRETISQLEQANKALTEGIEDAYPLVLAWAHTGSHAQAGLPIHTEHQELINKLESLLKKKEPEPAQERKLYKSSDHDCKFCGGIKTQSTRYYINPDSTGTGEYDKCTSCGKIPDLSFLKGEGE